MLQNRMRPEGARRNACGLFTLDVFSSKLWIYTGSAIEYVNSVGVKMCLRNHQDDEVYDKRKF
jgi:hypothetical protein